MDIEINIANSDDNKQIEIEQRQQPVAIRRVPIPNLRSPALRIPVPEDDSVTPTAVDILMSYSPNTPNVTGNA